MVKTHIDAKKELLLALLGELDASFLPSRIWAPPRPANTYCARQDYLLKELWIVPLQALNTVLG